MDVLEKVRLLYSQGRDPYTPLGSCCRGWWSEQQTLSRWPLHRTRDNLKQSQVTTHVIIELCVVNVRLIVSFRVNLTMSHQDTKFGFWRTSYSVKVDIFVFSQFEQTFAMYKVLCCQHISIYRIIRITCSKTLSPVVLRSKFAPWSIWLTSLFNIGLIKHFLFKVVCLKFWANF